MSTKPPSNWTIGDVAATTESLFKTADTIEESIALVDSQLPGVLTAPEFWPMVRALLASNAGVFRDLGKHMRKLQDKAEG